MADTLDLLTLAEGKTAINMSSTNDDHDTKLAQAITAVSRIIDDMCGPVVVRTVTTETHDVSGTTVRLARWPVTSITTVREARAGSISTLSAVAFGATTDGYLAPTWSRDPSLLSGVLHRRRFGGVYAWGSEVEVTYVAGRYATTSVVDARFKEAAGAVLRRLWKRESGVWAQSAQAFADDDPQAGSGFFRVAKPIIEEMLWDEVQTHLVGFA